LRSSLQNNNHWQEKRDCHVKAYINVKLGQWFPTFPTDGPPTAALNERQRMRDHAIASTWSTLRTNCREKTDKSWIHTPRKIRF